MPVSNKTMEKITVIVLRLDSVAATFLMFIGLILVIGLLALSLLEIHSANADLLSAM